MNQPWLAFFLTTLVCNEATVFILAEIPLPYLLFLHVYSSVVDCPSADKITNSEIRVNGLYQPDVHRRGWAGVHAWDLGSRKPPEVARVRRVDVESVVYFRCGGIPSGLYTSKPQGLLHVSGSYLSTTVRSSAAKFVPQLVGVLVFYGTP